jgi:hypothetical protein
MQPDGDEGKDSRQAFENRRNHAFLAENEGHKK